MKKLLICLAVCVTAGAGERVAWGQLVPARAKPFIIAANTQKIQKGSTLIRMTYEDAKPKSGVCPYYVRSFHYLESVRILDVEVFQELCANDAFGFSQGEVLWAVPGSLLAKGAPITVVINQAKVGTLVFDDARQAFEVKGD